MTEKQFEVTISSNNKVHFTENGINVISIGFNEYSDAVDCKNGLLPFCNRLNNLSEKNKELKQLIKEVLKLLEDEVDLFSDNATEHDINAYIELKELDNKDAYYMAISTKKAIKLLKEVIE